MALFTPMEAAIGGATLGVATVSRMALTGRILGHSGNISLSHFSPARCVDLCGTVR